jgi:multiple sugar transport system permease protein
MAVDLQPGAQAPAATPVTEPSRPPGPRRQRATWVYVVLAVGLLATLTPFLWMLLGSFKPEAELQRVPPTWWPETPSLDNYRELFDRLDFPRFFATASWWQ